VILAVVVLGAAVAVLVVVLTTRESGEESEATLVQNARLEHEGPAGTEAESEQAAGEEAESQHENSPGDLGGEAPREGPRSPVGELVEDRAYPKSYVSDRLALRGANEFKALPSSAPVSSFKSAAAYRAASSGGSQRWKALGPVTPDVAAEATQFFNIDTNIGTRTTNSGRVTAMAIDPNCGRKHAGCRVWVAAAGGGVWRTPDALAQNVKWKAPSQQLPTNSFGSLYVDPNDNSGDTLYAGSGEPNGSGDSEAGLGLFRSTDGGKTWHLVGGSRSVAIDRSIGTIAVKPGHPNVIYIGTDVARHGSSSVNGGRRTPPNAPSLGVYKSTDNGRHFRLMTDLQRQTPANPTPPSTGNDWFQGGVNKLMIDPNNSRRLYAAVFGYGVWRSNNGGKSWRQIFHTVNQTDFSNPSNPGDTFGDRTEFDLFNKEHHTGIYVGDSSDDLGVAEVWRAKGVDTKPANELLGNDDNAGWTKLSVTERDQRLPRLLLLPERTVRLRRLCREPAPPPGPGMARRLDELRRAPALRRSAAPFERPRRDSIGQRVGAGVAGHVAGHDPGRPAAGSHRGHASRPARDRLRSQEPGDRSRRLGRRRDPGEHQEPCGRVLAVRPAAFRLRLRPAASGTGGHEGLSAPA
jgi:hypothetical protein